MRRTERSYRLLWTMSLWWFIKQALDCWFLHCLPALCSAVSEVGGPCRVSAPCAALRLSDGDLELKRHLPRSFRRGWGHRVGLVLVKLTRCQRWIKRVEIFIIVLLNPSVLWRSFVCCVSCENTSLILFFLCCTDQLIERAWCYSGVLLCTSGIGVCWRVIKCSSYTAVLWLITLLNTRTGDSNKKQKNDAAAFCKAPRMCFILKRLSSAALDVWSKLCFIPTAWTKDSKRNVENILTWKSWCYRITLIHLSREVGCSKHLTLTLEAIWTPSHTDSQHLSGLTLIFPERKQSHLKLSSGTRSSLL